MTARRVAPVLAVVAAVAAACAAGGDAPTPTRNAVPSAVPADPVEVCTNQIVHWAGVDLAGNPDDPGFDYQHRALSARIDTALRRIVQQARAEGGAPPEVILERARTACAEMIAADPDPSGY